MSDIGEFTKIESMRLNEGDTLILTCPTRLTRKQYENFKALWERNFKGIGVKILVLEDGITAAKQEPEV